MHDGAEDDRRDEHLDQLDKQVAQRLHGLAKVRVEMAQQDTEHDGGKHLHIEMRVKRFVRNIGSRRKCRIHGLPPCKSTPVGALTSHNVTRFTGGCLQRVSLPASLWSDALHSAALGAGNRWIRHRSASKNGAMLQDAGRTRAFLIIRRNLVPLRERADCTCDFIENTGRALSGNPAVAALPQPPNDLDFPTLHTSSFRIFCTDK